MLRFYRDSRYFYKNALKDKLRHFVSSCLRSKRKYIKTTPPKRSSFYEIAGLPAALAEAIEVAVATLRATFAAFRALGLWTSFIHNQ